MSIICFIKSLWYNFLYNVCLQDGFLISGHSYVEQEEDGVLKCKICGKESE